MKVQSTTATTVKKVDEAPKKKQTKLSSFLKPVTPKASEEIPSTPAVPTVTESESPKDIVLEKISYDFEDEGAFLPGEGRTITLELNKFIVVGCYVPNSGKTMTDKISSIHVGSIFLGEGLVRLDYRVNEW